MTRIELEVVEKTEHFPAGTLIDRRYEIGERLGQGGMGTVYRAYDMKVGHVVALKMIATGGSERSREDRRIRFAREILAINEVHHPNVLHIQEYGFHGDTPYMVMEFLDGKDLAAVLRAHEGPLAIEHAVDIMLAVCAAIRACHASQVIHRDLKPGNIMIVKTDVGAGWDVRVVDFGISKTAGSSELTQEGKIVGTPAFLSPEQIEGKVGPESDQYAIGVLLYVCLTRHHPFGDLEGLLLVRAIEKGVFKRPREHVPEIPEELEGIILKAMRLDPGERHESVFVLGKQLWPFASPMGRQFWKRYYESSPVDAPRDDAKGPARIPLVKRMAEGELPVAPASSTVDQPGARAARADAAGSKRESMQAPGSWHWQSESGTADARPVPGGRSRLRSRVVMIAGAAAIAAIIAAAAARMTARQETAVPGAGPAAVPESAATIPPPAPRAAAPPPPPAEPPPPERKPAPKPRHHASHGQPRSSSAGWATDPAGNPVPPP